ncbi:MAG: hypothetical protein WD065_02555 [Planctomycetaceae bacterium]
MFARRFRLAMIVVGSVVVAANVACALGLQLGESKEELKLEYDIDAADQGTGRVTVTLTIADEGRLKPLTDVYLVIPDEGGSGYSDLSLSLAAPEVDGKRMVTVHLKRELAERAEFRLQTSHLDGKQEKATWYYHVIPIRDYIKNVDRKD